MYVSNREIFSDWEIINKDYHNSYMIYRGSRLTEAMHGLGSIVVYYK